MMILNNYIIHDDWSIREIAMFFYEYKKYQHVNRIDKYFELS